MSHSFDEDDVVVILDPEPRAPKTPRPATPLFREEVLAERRTQWLGTVLLTPRLSHRLFVLFALLATAALGAALLTGSYSRKARINGWLVPRGGLVQVYAPGSGLVSDVRVVEGQEVRRGDVLLVLSSEVESVARGATRAEVVRRLAARRDCVLLERTNAEAISAQRARALQQRLTALSTETTQLDAELKLTRGRVDMAVRALGRQRALIASGLASEQDADAAQEQRLEQETRLLALERSRTSIDRERLSLEQELEELPLRTRTDQLAFERTIAELEQELAENEARRELVVTAPADGIITGLQVGRGDQPRGDVPLLGVLPVDAEFEAHLFSPSRTVGQLRPGQRVLLRYPAFPFQRFGLQEGLVVDISRAGINPSELKEVAGLTSLVDPAQSLYRVRVRLPRKAVTTTGRELTLRSGLQLEADVVVDRRRLLEWALDPLLTLLGRFQ